MIFNFAKAAAPKQITGDTFSMLGGGDTKIKEQESKSSKHCFQNTSNSKTVTNLDYTELVWTDRKTVTTVFDRKGVPP